MEGVQGMKCRRAEFRTLVSKLESYWALLDDFQSTWWMDSLLQKP